MNKYDYIVAGAGAAGLSLLAHMIHSGKFTDKKILLIDRAPKTENDRTWCFWEKEPGIFESLVYKKWDKMWFHGEEGNSALHNTHPYQYKMIRGIDFYKHCFELIKSQVNISIEYGAVDNIYSSHNESYLFINGIKVYAEYIFSSIKLIDAFINNGEYFLWQHFKGWFIHTEKDIFIPDEATLMDFRIDQHNDTRFVYVMPFTKNDALLEYTVFSENKLEDQQYERGLKDYCKNKLSLNTNDYSVESDEFGMIPMTNYKFPLSQHNIIYIGSAGGQTKASSGYTFRFIQKHSKRIVQALIKNKSPQIHPQNKKFGFYDSVMLNILMKKKLSGAHIFTKLFENNKMNEVFKFLDNETSIGEDLKLISSLPKSKFISAAFSHMIKIS